MLVAKGAELLQSRRVGLSLGHVRLCKRGMSSSCQGMSHQSMYSWQSEGIRGVGVGFQDTLS